MGGTGPLQDETRTPAVNAVIPASVAQLRPIGLTVYHRSAMLDPNDTGGARFICADRFGISDFLHICSPPFSSSLRRNRQTDGTRFLAVLWSIRRVPPAGNH